MKYIPQCDFKKSIQTVGCFCFFITILYVFVHPSSISDPTNKSTFLWSQNKSFTTKPFFVPLIKSKLTFSVHHKLLLFYETAANVIQNIIKHYNVDLYGNSFDYAIKLMKEKYGIHGFIFYFYFHNDEFVVRLPSSRFLKYPFCLCLIDYDSSKNKSYQKVFGEKFFSLHEDMKNISYYFNHKNYMKVSLRPIILLENRFGRNSFTSSHNYIKLLSNSTYNVSYVQALDIQEIVSTLLNSQLLPSNWSFVNTMVRYEQFQLKRLDFKENKAVNSERILFAPMVYQNMLLQKLLSLNKPGTETEKFVFVNSWNDIVPNSINGYAYLEATRMALLQYNLLTTKEVVTVPKIAIFIHAFFVEILPEIIQYLILIEEQNIYKADLYVATINEHVEPVTSMFSAMNWTSHIFIFDNRGRDLLPFLTILDKIHANYNIIIKLNTKKSVHNKGIGHIWRSEAYNGLIEPYNFLRLIDQLMNNDSLGIIYPSGMALSLKNYICRGYDLFSQLSLRMGLDPMFAVEKLYFGAGTMFIAKTRALKMLLHIASSNTTFEAEKGQLDQTQAHAYERAIAVSVYKSGYTYAEADMSSGKIKTMFGNC